MPERPASMGRGEETVDRNEVVIVGRLAAAAESRVLPSGDQIAAFRVVVRRPVIRTRPARRPGSAGEGGLAAAGRRATVDTLDCTAWRADLRRSVLGWQPGDLVEVTGALRRRFWRSGGGPASRYDVEVARARRLRCGAG